MRNIVAQPPNPAEKVSNALSPLSLKMRPKINRENKIATIMTKIYNVNN